LNVKTNVAKFAADPLMWGKVDRGSEPSAISNTTHSRDPGNRPIYSKNWASSFSTLQKNPSFIIEGPYKRFSTQKIPKVQRVSEISENASTTVSRDSENHLSNWSSSYSTPQKVSFVADRPNSRFSLQKIRVGSRPLKIEKLDSNETTTSTPRSSTQAEDSKSRGSAMKKERCESTQEFLIQVLMKESSFRRLPAKELANAMWKQLLWTGDTLFRQGDVSNSYFIVTDGRLDIIVENDRGQLEKVSEIQKGASLGANGLMSSTKRSATVVASVRSTVWVLEAVSFRKIFRKYRSQSFDARFLTRLTFLKTVPILKTLPHRYLEHISSLFREVQYAKGTTIIRQSDTPHSFYLIKSGNAVVLKSKLQEDPIQVHSYGPTDFFGERGLIRKEPRAASVIATTEITCLLLGESDFAEIGKFLAKQFENAIAGYKDEKMKVPTGSAVFPKFVNRINTKLEEFKFIGILGIGSFGRVSLVKDPNTNKTYSLKSVRKMRVVETGQQEHMRNEKAVQAIMDSPFIVKLYATYQDRTCVYLLMEAILGGELFTVLRYNHKFSERTSRFYASCCVEAFDHMHSKDVIYRDLKPENLLIDKRGYIQITDFGFAKKRNNTSTLCGTPEYLAPEVIRNWTQSFAVDWWGLGILIYEMVVSHPPFEDDQHLKMYQKILRVPVDYPRHVTQKCRDIIDSLLRKNFRRRLGAGVGGADAVRQHTWFKGFKWGGLAKRTLKSPYVPRIRSREDLSCFEYYPDDEFKYEEEVYVDDNSSVFAWTADF